MGGPPRLVGKARGGVTGLAVSGRCGCPLVPVPRGRRSRDNRGGFLPPAPAPAGRLGFQRSGLHLRSPRSQAAGIGELTVGPPVLGGGPRPHKPAEGPPPHGTT